MASWMRSLISASVGVRFTEAAAGVGPESDDEEEVGTDMDPIEKDNNNSSNSPEPRQAQELNLNCLNNHACARQASMWMKAAKPCLPSPRHHASSLTSFN